MKTHPLTTLSEQDFRIETIRTLSYIKDTSFWHSEEESFALNYADTRRFIERNEGIEAILEMSDADYAARRQLWFRTIRKLKKLGVLGIIEETKDGFVVRPERGRMDALLDQYVIPDPLQCGRLILDLKKATLRYRRNKPITISPGSQPILFLRMLMENGEATYADMRSKLGQSRGQRSISFIRRDLRNLLLQAGMPDREIKQMVVAKPNRGYVMRCND